MRRHRHRDSEKRYSLDRRDLSSVFGISVGLVIVGLILNYNSWNYPFLNMDDLSGIVLNDIVHATSASELLRVFDWNLYSERGITAYYPIRDLTFAIDHWVYGLDGAGFHLTNLILHLTFVVLLAWFCVAVFGFTAIEAFWLGLLVISCPMVATAVGWVYSRKVSLLGIFILGYIWGLYCARKSDRRVSIGTLLALVCLIASTLSHPFGFVAPGLALAWCWSIPVVKYQVRSRAGFITARDWISTAVHLGVILLPFYFALSRAETGALFELDEPPTIWSRVAVLPLFVYNVIWPYGINLNVSHQFISMHVVSIAIGFSVIALVGGLGALWFVRRKQPIDGRIVFSILAVFIFLSPLIVFKPTAVPFALRYGYVPVAFVMVAVVVGIINRVRSTQSRMWLLLLIILFQAVAYPFVARAYSSSTRYWTKALSADPRNVVSRINLIKALYLAKRDRQMEDQFRVLHKLYPKCVPCMVYHGRVLRSLNNCKAALVQFERAKTIRSLSSTAQQEYDDCRRRQSGGESP